MRWNYTVQTSPNIGSDHETGVHDGTYTVPMSWSHHMEPPITGM